jgi:hypothetical protein
VTAQQLSAEARDEQDACDDTHDLVNARNRAGCQQHSNRERCDDCRPQAKRAVGAAMGDWLQLAGALLCLLGATPALFEHPHSEFLGLRLAVGITMLIACIGMTVFLIQGELLWLSVVAVLAWLLGLLGTGLLISRQSAYRALSANKRRRVRRKMPDFGLTAVIWLGGLIGTAGVAISIMSGS